MRKYTVIIKKKCIMCDPSLSFMEPTGVIEPIAKGMRALIEHKCSRCNHTEKYYDVAYPRGMYLAEGEVMEVLE